MNIVNRQDVIMVQVPRPPDSGVQPTKPSVESVVVLMLVEVVLIIPEEIGDGRLSDFEDVMVERAEKETECVYLSCENYLEAEIRLTGLILLAKAC